MIATLHVKRIQTWQVTAAPRSGDLGHGLTTSTWTLVQMFWSLFAGDSPASRRLKRVRQSIHLCLSRKVVNQARHWSRVKRRRQKQCVLKGNQNTVFALTVRKLYNLWHIAAGRLLAEYGFVVQTSRSLKKALTKEFAGLAKRSKEITMTCLPASVSCWGCATKHIVSACSPHLIREDGESNYREEVNYIAKSSHYRYCDLFLKTPSYCPAFICPIVWTPAFFDINVHSLSHALEQLCYRVFVSRFWQASLLECHPFSS